MRKWSEFGEQVNRLVYTLAGRNFQADIDCANRFIAERIFYSEVSVRMMRQGRFRPREENALETLVEIGKTEADLDREWASRLLYSSQHPNPEKVLQKIYPEWDTVRTDLLAPIEPSPTPAFIYRLVGGVLGSFATLLIWTYAINPIYPAPHELTLLREMIWGLLIGVGLAGGMAGSDLWAEKRTGKRIFTDGLSYLVLPVSGVCGALLWHFVGANIFSPPLNGQVTSTAGETFSFGAMYGLIFGVGTILVYRLRYTILSHREQIVLVILYIIICSGATLVGFILATVQPAFANQKDVDLFVGLMIRFGLIFSVSIWFPPRNYLRQYHDDKNFRIQQSNE